MKYISIGVSLFLTFSICVKSFAQSDSSYVISVETYVAYIDSINKIDYVQDIGFMKGIADGVIKKDKKTIGGFGVYTLTNFQGDTAFRILYHDNIDVNIYKTYYYRFDKLIYATLELKDERGMKSLYLKEEYFRDDVSLATSIKKDSLEAKFRSKTRFSLLQDGQEYMNDFIKNYRGH